MKKLLATGIIFLFIGVAVAPSINSNVINTSDDNDLVEVISQACGIQGFGNTTVKLTKHQYQDLEQYLVDFRARLNQTATREEAVPIFNDAVVELNKFGLLPKGMSVEKAQKIMTHPKKLAALTNQINLSVNHTQIYNSFCSVTGSATECGIASFLSAAIEYPFYILAISYHVNPYIPPLGLYFLYAIWMLASLPFYLRNTIPLVSTMLGFFGIFSLLTFGTSVQTSHGLYNYPSQGWIDTIGSYGNRNLSGYFFGFVDIPVLNFFGMRDTGVSGFTGLKILLPGQQSFFLGTAIWVNVGNNY